MHEKVRKVLVVDDQNQMCRILKRRFEAVQTPYLFKVDVASSAAECIEKIRNEEYDVVVLDINMEERKSGLEASLSFGLCEQLGRNQPVRIIFTGHPDFRDCVEAVRFGAWDYIVKEDLGDTPMTQIVVNSSVTRLRQLDLRQEQEAQIAAHWLPQQLHELQAKYSGKYIALWHQPGTKVNASNPYAVKIVAHGDDAFELDANLKEWRKQHEAWEQAFIVQIP